MHQTHQPLQAAGPTPRYHQHCLPPDLPLAALLLLLQLVLLQLVQQS
jgi:hypothetical protein